MSSRKALNRCRGMPEVLTKKIQSVCSLSKPLPKQEACVSCCPLLASKWLRYRQVLFQLAIEMFLLQPLNTVILHFVVIQVITQIMLTKILFLVLISDRGFLLGFVFFNFFAFESDFCPLFLFCNF